MIVRERWLNSYQMVFSRPDTEVYRVPPELEQFSLRIAGLDEIAQTRRKSQFDRKGQARDRGYFEPGSGYIKRAEDYERERQTRQLNRDARGFKQDER